MSRFVTVTNGYPSIDVGALRHQVQILSPAVADPIVYDEAGPVVSDSVFCSGWAAIDIVRGLDVIRGGQATTQTYLAITMWYQPGIQSNMRVKSDNGSEYVIQSVENVLEMNVVMVLNCVALGANQ